jgi:Peptidase A4 family
MSARTWLAAAAAAAVAVVSAAGIVSPAASASVQLSHRSGVTKVTSPHWAGYAAVADKGTRFRYVAADFDFTGPGCPLPNSPSQGAVASDWIGLDGFGRNHGPAEQIGLSVGCGPDHISWWLWYKGASGGKDDLLFCEIGGCADSPNFGDRINLSVYFNGKSYRFIYDDVTMKVVRKFYLSCRKCRNANRSAEVINQIEAGGGYNPGGYTVDFFGVRVTSVSGRAAAMAPQPRHWTTDEITMVDPAGINGAFPSALLRHGRAFHVTAG